LAPWFARPGSRAAWSARFPPNALWDGFWEFPTVHLNGADPAGRSFGEPVGLAEGVRRLSGIPIEVGPVVQTLRFGVTKHRVELVAHEARGLGDDPSPGPGLIRAVWETPEALSNYPFGTAGRRLVAWALKHMDLRRSSD
jgi:A/G-specific adenine glycosylase